MTHIVTRDTLQALMDRNDEVTRHAVGRALVVLFKRQTETERQANETNTHNNVGFTSGDAWGGCIAAKTYIKNGTLADWQVAKWTKRSATTGYSRLCKYWRQLDEAAQEKANRREAA